MKLRRCLYRPETRTNSEFNKDIYYFHQWVKIQTQTDMDIIAILESQNGRVFTVTIDQIKFIDPPELSEAVTSPGTQAKQS